MALRVVLQAASFLIKNGPAIIGWIKHSIQLIEGIVKGANLSPTLSDDQMDQVAHMNSMLADMQTVMGTNIPVPTVAQSDSRTLTAWARVAGDIVRQYYAVIDANVIIPYTTLNLLYPRSTRFAPTAPADVEGFDPAWMSRQIAGDQNASNKAVATDAYNTLVDFLNKYSSYFTASRSDVERSLNGLSEDATVDGEAASRDMLQKHNWNSLSASSMNALFRILPFREVAPGNSLFVPSPDQWLTSNHVEEPLSGTIYSTGTPGQGMAGITLPNSEFAWVNATNDPNVIASPTVFTSPGDPDVETIPAACTIAGGKTYADQLDEIVSELNAVGAGAPGLAPMKVVPFIRKATTTNPYAVQPAKGFDFPSSQFYSWSMTAKFDVTLSGPVMTAVASSGKPAVASLFMRDDGEGDSPGYYGYQTVALADGSKLVPIGSVSFLPVPGDGPVTISQMVKIPIGNLNKNGGEVINPGPTKSLYMKVSFEGMGAGAEGVWVIPISTGSNYNSPHVKIRITPTGFCGDPANMNVGAGQIFYYTGPVSDPMTQKVSLTAGQSYSDFIGKVYESENDDPNLSLTALYVKRIGNSGVDLGALLHTLNVIGTKLQIDVSYKYQQLGVQDGLIGMSQVNKWLSTIGPFAGVSSANVSTAFAYLWSDWYNVSYVARQSTVGVAALEEVRPGAANSTVVTIS